MARDLPIQEKKVYRNSECEFCDNLMKDVKLKDHPKTNEPVIICKACFSILWLKENPKK